MEDFVSPLSNGFEALDSFTKTKVSLLNPLNLT
jgi:hypothetical protein